MPLTICYAPVVDGKLDMERGYCREAVRYDEVVEGETCSLYALPEGRDASEFTVTDLNQADAEALAQRVCATAQASKGGTWNWEVS